MFCMRASPYPVLVIVKTKMKLSPSIVFIDEIDAVGTKRYDAHSGKESLPRVPTGKKR